MLIPVNQHFKAHHTLTSKEQSLFTKLSRALTLANTATKLGAKPKSRYIITQILSYHFLSPLENFVNVPTLVSMRFSAPMTMWARATHKLNYRGHISTF